MASAWSRRIGLAVAIALGASLVGTPARARYVMAPVGPAPLALAAVTAADGDVRTTRLIGPSGQVYEPDGAGTWTRRIGGGVAADVTAAFQLGPQLVVTGRGAPMYTFDGNLWRAAPIGQRGRVVTGAGSLPAVAIGTQVFVRDKQTWLRVGTAPAPITAVWATSKTNGRLATATTVFTLRGGAFAPVAPALVATALVGTVPYAVTAAGLVDTSKPKQPVAAAVTDVVAAATVPPSAKDLWLVSAPAGAAPSLLLLHAGKLGAPIGMPLAAGVPIAGITADHGGRVLVITTSGEIHVWDDHAKAWSTGVARDEVAGPGRGPGPARTR